LIILFRKTLLAKSEIEKEQITNKFEKELEQSKTLIQELEKKLKDVKKRECPFPNCDSLNNFRSSTCSKHYSLESCPNWNKVILSFD
jgi:hypothetical protein